MKKRIAMAFLLATLAATPVYAAEVQDFGTAGNVSVQQVPNGNGGSDDWIVVSPGESGRGVKIVDENGKAAGRECCDPGRQALCERQRI